MNSVQYLEQELKVIADKFPNVNIRYGYNNSIKTHIVELLPLVEYNNNEDLDKAWIPLSISFIQKYMDEEIAFISSDSSLSLKKIIFEFNPSACTEQNIIAGLFQPLTEKEVHYTYTTRFRNGKVMNNFSFDLSKPEIDDHDPIETDTYYLAAA